MSVQILVGDCRETLGTLPAESVQCVVTSPPYWGLRDYGVAGQLGLERTPEEYVGNLVTVFREVRRLLRKDGTVWLNLGDSYCAAPKGHSGFGTTTLTNQGQYQQECPRPTRGRNPKPGQEQGDVTRAPHRSQPLPGIKPKDIIGIPWLVAQALRGDGWYLRAPIIWAKPNGMPGSQKDRPTINHEYVWLLSKSRHYYYDHMAVRNRLAQSSIARLSQPTLETQAGSARANGGAKTNGSMKAVKFGGDKRMAGSGGGGLHRERERERERERVHQRPTLQRQRMEGALKTLAQRSARCGGFLPNRTSMSTLRSCPKRLRAVASCSAARLVT